MDQVARTVPGEVLGIRSLQIVSGTRPLCPICWVRQVDVRLDDASQNLCATCFILRGELSRLKSLEEWGCALGLVQ